MSDVLAPSVFTIQNNSADATIGFKADSQKMTILPDSSNTSKAIPANATVPFSIFIGSSKELSLYVEESEDLTSIQVTALNGWTETQNNNPYVFSYGTGEHPPTFTITLTDNNPAPDEIGILIVGTTECDPEETGK